MQFRQRLADFGEGEAAGWLEVVLPGRPNGATGWVRATDVEVRELDVEVEVDLTSRELRVLQDGEVVLTTEVAIGEDDHPTPTGRFFVTDKLDTEDPDGAYGPYAIGLSGRSEVLTEFAGGDGQIGIHGTNDPASIGRAVSFGCVRVPNAVVRELVTLLPLGTPVVIS
jgi:lipoprotein-anchoring transpeptidase ErfK/SrfK